MLDEYVRDLKQAAEVIKEYDEVTLAHHNDADGLSSAAILMEALAREGINVRNIPLERVHPEIVKRLVTKFKGLLLFADLGAGAAPIISKINAEYGGNEIIIIDHHHAGKVQDPKVRVLSTEIYGISGDKDISAAGAAYLFALNLNEENKDLAYLSVIGAVGDSHHRFGRLVGVNRKILMEAVGNNQIEITSENNGRERYFLKIFDGIDVERFAKNLTVLGAVGYLMNGPDIGIKVAVKGPDEEYHNALKNLKSLKARAFEEVIEKLKRQGLLKGKYVQWFHVHDAFAPMGVKVIGEFCMEIKDRDFVDPHLYLAGFQNMPKEIPKLGRFDWEIVKVSFRLPSKLEEKVLGGKMPGYNYIVPCAASTVGGDVDACHGYACATTFSKGLEEAFIKSFDECVEKYLAGH